MHASEIKSSRNPIQSISESKSESNTILCSEQKATEPPEPPEPPEPQEPPVIGMQLNTGEEYPITQQDINGWMELYPAVDVMQELRKMKGWCIDNPKKRKTKGGIKRFIGGWLAKEQDKGGTAGYVRRTNQVGSSKVEQYAASAREWADG